jgi:VanZ family protein
MPRPEAIKESVPDQQQPATALPLYLCIAYIALITYASLHPFSGWRDPGLALLTFLESPWPRYWTVFDLLVNVLAYLPLGFLLTLTLRRVSGRGLAALAALLLGTALSLALECVQTWLPSRVPSNVDLACNSLGCGLGVLLALRQDARLFERIARLQHYLLAPKPHAEAGLVLLGLWLLIQLSPETQLFGAGNLRPLLELTPAVPYAARSFFAIETAVTICNMIAVGLMARTLMGNRGSPYLIIAAFFIIALIIRTLAAAVLVAPGDAFAWLTPGAGLGLLTGGLLLSLLLLLPTAWRIALAGVLLMAATVLVNLAPPNPYSAAALATWRQGHFLNFNGLTRLASSFWPFIALPYLTLLARRL